MRAGVLALCTAAWPAAQGKWMDWEVGVASRHTSWAGSTCGLGTVDNGVEGMPDWMKPEQQVGGKSWQELTGDSDHNQAYMVAALNPRLFYDETGEDSARGKGYGDSVSGKFPSGHGWGCGRCFEVKCVSSKTDAEANSAIQDPCDTEGRTAIVWGYSLCGPGDDQCPHAAHDYAGADDDTNGFQFDLSSSAFYHLANKEGQATGGEMKYDGSDVVGVMKIQWRQVSCTHGSEAWQGAAGGVPSAQPMLLDLEGSDASFSVWPKHVGGRGKITKMEFQSQSGPVLDKAALAPEPNTWTDMTAWDGSRFRVCSESAHEHESNKRHLGYGPYKLRITSQADDGTLEQIVWDVPTSLCSSSDVGGCANELSACGGDFESPNCPRNDDNTCTCCPEPCQGEGNRRYTTQVSAMTTVASVGGWPYNQVCRCGMAQPDGDMPRFDEFQDLGVNFPCGSNCDAVGTAQPTEPTTPAPTKAPTTLAPTVPTTPAPTKAPTTQAPTTEGGSCTAWSYGPTFTQGTVVQCGVCSADANPAWVVSGQPCCLDTAQRCFECAGAECTQDLRPLVSTAWWTEVACDCGGSTTPAPTKAPTTAAPTSAAPTKAPTTAAPTSAATPAPTKAPTTAAPTSAAADDGFWTKKWIGGEMVNGAWKQYCACEKVTWSTTTTSEKACTDAWLAEGSCFFDGVNAVQLAAARAEEKGGAVSRALPAAAIGAAAACVLAALAALVAVRRSRAAREATTDAANAELGEPLAKAPAKADSVDV